MSARALLLSYCGLWAATVAGALLALAGAPLVTLGFPHDALDAGVATATRLLAHNAAVALWPLALVALGWPALGGAGLLADGLIAAHLLAHGLLVGSAVAQHPDTWRFLPNLPLEWLAIATPAAAWLHARTRLGTSVTSPVELAGIATACLAALAGAAVIETYLVPVT